MVWEGGVGKWRKPFQAVSEQKFLTAGGAVKASVTAAGAEEMHRLRPGAAAPGGQLLVHLVRPGAAGPGGRVMV